MSKYGWKTIAGAIGLGVATVLHALGIIDSKTYEVIAAFLLTWTGVSARIAIGKSGPQ
jgi:hypothetical protein